MKETDNKEEKILAEFKVKLEALLAEYPDVFLGCKIDGDIVATIAREGQYSGFATIVIDA
jgi:hypothetical protein